MRGYILLMLNIGAKLPTWKNYGYLTRRQSSSYTLDARSNLTQPSAASLRFTALTEPAWRNARQRPRPAQSSDTNHRLRRCANLDVFQFSQVF